MTLLYSKIMLEKDLVARIPKSGSVNTSLDCKWFIPESCYFPRQEGNKDVLIVAPARRRHTTREADKGILGFKG